MCDAQAARVPARDRRWLAFEPMRQILREKKSAKKTRETSFSKARERTCVFSSRGVSLVCRKEFCEAGAPRRS